MKERIKRIVEATKEFVGALLGIPEADAKLVYGNPLILTIRVTSCRVTDRYTEKYKVIVVVEARHIVLFPTLFKEWKKVGT